MECGRTGPKSAQTLAYGDLTLAFGLARLGQRDASGKLVERARDALRGRDEAHRFLLAAYEYRVRQALAGKPHAGPLPAGQLESLGRMERLPQYMVDRLRKHSSIVEPDQRINPYRQWAARISALEKALAELPDLADGREVARRVDRLLADLPEGAEGGERRVRVLQAGLEAAPGAGEEFAQRMLKQSLLAYDSLPRTGEAADLEARAVLLEKALFAAARFGCADHVRSLAAQLERLLTVEKGRRPFPALDSAIGECLRGLRKLDMRVETGRLSKAIVVVVLEGKEVESVDFRNREGGPAALRALLHAASGWRYLGRADLAEPVLRAARRALLEGEPLPPREQTQLACAYVRAVGQGATRMARERLAEVLKLLKGVRDTYTTSTHFSSSQLEVLEAVVLAVVGED